MILNKSIWQQLWVFSLGCVWFIDSSFICTVNRLSWAKKLESRVCSLDQMFQGLDSSSGCGGCQSTSLMFYPVWQQEKETKTVKPKRGAVRPADPPPTHSVLLSPQLDATSSGRFLQGYTEACGRSLEINTWPLWSKRRAWALPMKACCYSSTVASITKHGDTKWRPDLIYMLSETHRPRWHSAVEETVMYFWKALQVSHNFLKIEDIGEERFLDVHVESSTHFTRSGKMARVRYEVRKHRKDSVVWFLSWVC